MFSKTLELVRGSELVWKFQELCGVKRKLHCERVVKVEENQCNGYSKSIAINSKKEFNSRNDEPNGDISEGQTKPRLEGNCTRERLIIGRQSAENEDLSQTKTPDGTAEIAEDDYLITNKVLHWMFWLGTALGDETFCSNFFPMWFWNWDSYIGRRIVVVWMLTMYIGQGLKDVIRWPRPVYPAVRMRDKWSMEYGMPSTHAMVACSIPFSVFIIAAQRYQISYVVGLLICCSWCILVSSSRIYQGMHSILDIIGGISLAMILMLVVHMPIGGSSVLDMFDYYQQVNPWSPLVIAFVLTVMVVKYPECDKWTRARGDTTCIIAGMLGASWGAWCSHHLGLVTNAAPENTLFELKWLPSASEFVLIFARMVVGVFILYASKSGMDCVLCHALSKVPKWSNVPDYHVIKRAEMDIQDARLRERVYEREVTHKFITYVIVSMCVVFAAPLIFIVLHIERPDFVNEF